MFRFKLFKASLFLSITVLFLNCSQEPEKSVEDMLIGVWKFESFSFSEGISEHKRHTYEEMRDLYKESVLFELKSDKTYKVTFEGRVMQEGPWQLEEDIIVLKTDHPETQGIVHDHVHIENVSEDKISLSHKEEETIITAHFARQ